MHSISNSDLTAKKSLGQHWLRDEASLRAVVEAAEVGAEDTVLEIGPGQGTLTAQLLPRVKKVVAVEFDRVLAAQLPQRLPVTNLRVIEADILSFDLSVLPAGYKVVANIPYYLTSNLLRVLCESANPPSQMALLVQKELAERVVAAPGQMSLLSVSVQLYCQASLGQVVPARMFTPPPKVDSQILRLVRYQTPLFPDLDSKVFFRLVKAGFSNRRKTLHNSLAAGLRLSKAQIASFLDRAGLHPNSRPQELSMTDWYALYKVCHKVLTDGGNVQYNCTSRG